MSAVGNAVKSAAGFLVGGDKSTIQGTNYAPMSADEQSRLKDIEGSLKSLYGNQSSQAGSDQSQANDLNALFSSHLKDFLTSGGQTTPEQIQQASNFVDQTFTNPAQAQMKQQLTDLQSNYAASAAAMGRNPNLDIASQQAFASDASRAGLGLQAERGARIQQNVNDQYSRNLGSLNAGLQGSGYLNNLAQQAFSNQLNLLNGRTGLADYYQKQRSLSNVGTQTSSGLFNHIAAIGNGASKVGSMFASLGAGGGVGGMTSAGGFPAGA